MGMENDNSPVKTGPPASVMVDTTRTACCDLPEVPGFPETNYRSRATHT